MQTKCIAQGQNILTQKGIELERLAPPTTVFERLAPPTTVFERLAPTTVFAHYKKYLLIMQHLQESEHNKLHSNQAIQTVIQR